MSSHTYNSQELEVRRQLLREELANLETEKMKNLGGMQIIDFHHPERSPGWPLYNVNDPRNAWPRLMYHPTERDPRNEERRLGVRRRNEQNPHLAPMDVPDSEPLTVKVGNDAEKRLAVARGFVETPPTRQMIDINSPLEMIGRGLSNPLLDNPQPAASAPQLDVERILALNAMTREALAALAKEQCGLTLDPSLTKAAMVAAVAYAPVSLESHEDFADRLTSRP